MSYMENDKRNLSNVDLNEVNGANWLEQEISQEWYAKSNYILYEKNELNEQYQYFLK